MLTITALFVTFVTLHSATYAGAASPECIFGPDCSLPCRCQSGPCDAQTGTCVSTDTCSEYPPLYPWSGPGCQTGNLAYGRRTVADNNQVSNPINGTIPVDGDLNTCILIDTNDGWNNPFWIVDLEQPYVVQSVDIYHRLLDGYNIDAFTAKLSISLSNTSSFGPACGSYEGPFLTNAPISLQCDNRQLARYIKVTRQAVGVDFDPNPERFNLCEVVVVGHEHLDVDCDKCLIQDTDFCGNGIWCEACQAGFELPDCREAQTTVSVSTSTLSSSITTSSTSTIASPTSSVTSPTSTTTSSTSTLVSPTSSVTSPTSTTTSSTSTLASPTSSVTSPTNITSSTSTITPPTSTATARQTSSDPSSPTDLGSTSSRDGSNNMRSSSSYVTQMGTTVSTPKDDKSSSSKTSIQLIIFTVIGIFIVILVTLGTLGICVCIRRHRAKNAYGDTPDSTLTRRQRRHIENGYPHKVFNANEEFADNLSRHSSILDIDVMETIHEEKDSSKHSSCSSLHSTNVKAEGSSSMNGSVKRYSNRSL